MADAVALPHRVRTLLTPEGVALSLTLADASVRLVAFLVDVLLIVLFLLALSLLSIAAGRGAGGSVAVAIWLVGFFFLRNFYFAAFELTARAATPGKRMFGMRVAARDGGRLTADAILARNLVRELEVFLPLTILFVQGTRADGWLLLLGIGWTWIFLFFPLFNRDRLRVGDLLAGTWVVLVPRRKLLADLATEPARPERLSFTKSELSAYGVKELHVLEDVLRHRDARAMAVVAERIAAKIGRVRGAESDAEFLTAYYAGLRGELERGLLFGRRRRDKFDRT